MSKREETERCIVCEYPANGISIQLSDGFNGKLCKKCECHVKAALRRRAGRKIANVIDCLIKEYSLDDEGNLIDSSGKIPYNYAKKELYAYIMVRGKLFRLHRATWIHVNGAIPKGLTVDHIDGNTFNNRITNLRLVTYRESAQNKGRHRRGWLVGAYKEGDRWTSEISIKGSGIYLGSYDTEKEAHEVYKVACGIEREFNGDKKAFRALVKSKAGVKDKPMKYIYITRDRYKVEIPVNGFRVSWVVDELEDAFKIREQALSHMDEFLDREQYKELIETLVFIT